MSGLHASVGGIQEARGVITDLACFGKRLANGIPLSVLVERKQWMRDVLTINYSLTFRLEAMSVVAAIETIRAVNESRRVPRSRPLRTDLKRSLCRTVQNT